MRQICHARKEFLAQTARYRSQIVGLLTQETFVGGPKDNACWSDGVLGNSVRNQVTSTSESADELLARARRLELRERSIFNDFVAMVLTRILEPL